MKHAGADTLDRLEPLLAALRALPGGAQAGLREKQRGVFYRRGQAFLHFHDDPAGLFADLREHPGAAFTRFALGDGTGHGALLSAVRAALGG
jgi:hypothetical protein